MRELEIKQPAIISEVAGSVQMVNLYILDVKALTPDYSGLFTTRF